ncbi:MAG TPA: hypothetical protein VLF68_04790 [Candidatus Saccharimonadales bacterium]|nr:hypothetical protein [Candidatus Saccharimonadales bacterium]
MAGEIGINAERTAIRTGGTEHPISFGGVEEPNQEYKIRTYSFPGEKGKEADGCIFEIKPFGSTTVMRVVDDVHLREIAIKGNGWFLGVDADDGQMVPYEVGEDVVENWEVQQKKGSVGVWIAGKDGLEVLDITEPPFSPKMETPVERDDQNLPSGFWERYDELKAPPA